MSKFATEQEEVENLLSQATYPAVQELLKDHIATLAHISSIQNDFPGALELEDDEPVPATTARIEAEAVDTENKSNVPLTPPTPPSIPTVQSSKSYIPISSFAWDQAGMDKPLVTIYVDILNVGTIPVVDREQQIRCHFSVDSFDLMVEGLNGKNYRLVQDNLDKDIDPPKCKYIVKADKIVIKLYKAVDSSGSGMGMKYENWTVLASKKTREQKIAAKKKKTNNPMDSIQDMMKDMYDDGDDKMKSIIGEAMSKSRQGGAGLGNM